MDCPCCHGSGKSTSRTTQCPRCHSHVSLLNNFCGNCGLDVQGMYDNFIYCGGSRKVRDDTYHIKHTSKNLLGRTKLSGAIDSPFSGHTPFDSISAREANWPTRSPGVGWQGRVRDQEPLTLRVEDVSSNYSGGVSIWWLVFLAILVLGICGACWWFSGPL